MKSVQIDITGNRYGLLTVLKFSHRTNGKSRHYIWKCQCDCGNISAVDAGNLKNGTTGSCGCERGRRARLSRTKHGHTSGGVETAEFTTWKSMIQRCSDPNSKSYKNYGARGIAVCERWASDFMAFLTDMGARPSADHSLDRIDVNRGYEPENCKWSTRSEQARNRRDRAVVAFEGRERSVADLCDELCLPYNTIWQRLFILKWSAERALSEPIRGR